jgi:chitin synthase
MANNLPGRRGDFGASQEKVYSTGRYIDETTMEMDDMHSQYSSVRPASTILTGFPAQARQVNPYMPPQSPGPFMGGANMPGNRNSHMSNFSRYTDYPQMGGGPPTAPSRHLSVGNLSAYQDQPNLLSSRHSIGLMQSTENLLSNSRSRSPMGQYPSRPASTAFDFRGGSSGPDEQAITEAIRSCLAEVDLDTVTKKQGKFCCSCVMKSFANISSPVRSLVEQRLQTSLMGDKRGFLDRQIDQELANM